MAIGTPTHLIAAGATATSATSASFTPSASVRIFALCAARGATDAAPTISDSLGGTWTLVTGSDIDAGNVAGSIYYQDVGASPSARTVTVTATGTPTQVACEIFEISGSGAISSNFQSNVNAAGDPSVTMSAYAASSIAVAMGIGNAGSTWTQPTGFTEIYDLAPATNVRLNVSYDMVSPATSLSWTSTSTDSIGYGLEITEAAAGGAYTLTANTAAVTLTGASTTLKVDRRLAANTAAISLTGSSATLRVGRKVSAGTNAVTLTGSSATLTYTPSAAGAYVLTAEPAQVTVTGSTATLTYTSSRPPEVNWPGTNIPRSRFREMQRAALAQYLHDERERLQKEADEQKPAPRKVKRAVARIIRKVEQEGLLTEAQIQEAAPAIKQAITSNVSIQSILDDLRLSEITFIAEQQMLDDEAAAILLLAA